MPASDKDEELSDLKEKFEYPDVSHDGNGVNFYLRLGAVGFGLGTMLLAGFRISERLENSVTLECRSTLFPINAALMIIFVFTQTFFIFKHHRVIINRRKPIVRLCLMHLLATNLSVWLSAVTHETAEDIGRAPHTYRPKIHQREAMRLIGINSQRQNTYFCSSGMVGLLITETRVVIDNHSNNSHPRVNCHDTHTLSDLSAPYLYPCMIEYSLIGAAASYRIFLNVGKAIVRRKVSIEEFTSFHSKDECHRSTKGLFLGLFMILVTLVCVALFFVFDRSEYTNKTISSLIFVCSEIFLNTISFFASIIGIFMIRNLDFTGKDEDTFDDKLLMIAQVGYYMLTTFVALASADALAKSKHIPLSPLYLVMSLMGFLQTTAQSFFIFDGFSRCAANDDHVNRKPGRSVITFLLVVNLAMWATSTFEVKKAEVAELHVSFYTYLPWSIIMHLCLPLVIFYRFHSSVCLSDIWHQAYIKRGKIE
ncbi:proton channel OtopLc-like [Tubulanus polymorphus]|uniref:proton channel OtopLc-like n=1 Tax=Tubulanus polymorphus TaxID=672921 RepID=UPI003DA550F7